MMHPLHMHPDRFALSSPIAPPHRGACVAEVACSRDFEWDECIYTILLRMRLPAYSMMIPPSRCTTLGTEPYPYTRRAIPRLSSSSKSQLYPLKCLFRLDSPSSRIPFVPSRLSQSALMTRHTPPLVKMFDIGCTSCIFSLFIVRYFSRAHTHPLMNSFNTLPPARVPLPRAAPHILFLFFVH